MASVGLTIFIRNTLFPAITRREHPQQEIHLLSTESCVCSTMSLINLPRLCWAVENLAAGTPVGVIEVEPETARWALEALRRMLEVK